MDPSTSSAPDDPTRLFQRVVAQFDAPAYVRRARRTEDAYELLLATCRHQREEWLYMVRVRLALLRAYSRDWESIPPLLEDEGQLDSLRRMDAELKPTLQHRIEPTFSRRELRRLLGELIESIERFNCRWQEFLSNVDLTGVNELREGYNRYYLLEKECAGHSPALARRGFRRLEPVTTQDLLTVLPLLPVPRPR